MNGTLVTSHNRVFEDFYRREYPGMVALAAAVSGSGAFAEDIAQEALVRAHRSWKKISGYDKPGAWLRRVTINLATNRRRRDHTERDNRIRLVDPASTVELDLRDDEVWGAVADLPPKQRAAVALYYLEDRSVEDIAEILGVAVNTAKSHLHLGRQALAARLEEGEYS
jgi:RNA polymerase sigma-70 factor (ECF subfamily)